MSQRIEKEGWDSPIFWIDPPTIYADGVLGSSQGHGVHRVVLGQITFNNEPDSTTPAIKPVCELVMPSAGVRELITFLKGLPGVSDDEGN